MQGIQQRFAHMGFVRSLRQQVHRIHSHARVEVVARREQEQLLDALIVQRSLRFLGGDRVVLDADMIGSRLLRDRPDAGNGSRFDGRSLPGRLVGCCQLVILRAGR